MPKLNWTTRKNDRAQHYTIHEGNTARGSIKYDGSRIWEVELIGFDFKYRSESWNRCIGFVHGVEQMLNLNARTSRAA